MGEIKLPPLPERHWPRGYFGSVPSGAYTADQMHDYAREAERMGFLRGLEAAAKVAEGQAIMTDDQGMIQLGDVDFIAECIRSLAATKQGGSDG